MQVSFAARRTFSMLQRKITQSLCLYHKWGKDISVGLVVRILILVVTLYFGLAMPNSPDVNDMNELIALGLLNMFQGKNPYNRVYWLSAASTVPQAWYCQNFMNYGPMNLLLHLPAMIYPIRISGAGFMDFMPSFTILHFFFDFLMFDRLMRMDRRRGAAAIWSNPVMVQVDITTHMSVVLFLILMGYEHWKDPVQSVFWLGLGTITYQYVVVLLLFVIGYHIRSFSQVLRGLLPALLVIGVFQVWAMAEGRPLALIHDLFLVQLARPYELWSNHTFGIFQAWPWTASLPVIIFNLYGTDFVTDWTGGLIKLSTLMMIISLAIAVVLLLHLMWKSSFGRSQIYCAIVIVLVLLSSPVGVWHHRFIEIFPAFFAGLVVHHHFRRRSASQRAQNSTGT